MYKTPGVARNGNGEGYHTSSELLYPLLANKSVIDEN